MKPLISFTEFIRLPKDVQESMSRFENEGLNEELSSKSKERNMKSLEKLLKSHDWYYSYGDQKAWKKGKKENEDIRRLVDLIGDDGMELYKMYGRKAGVMEGKENKKERKPSEYEVFVGMKMKEWEIKSLEELEAEVLKRFWKEVDRDWKGNDEVEVNLPEKRSMFPEMNAVTRKGTLGYGDDRRVGEKSITANTFGGNGDLYPEHLVPKFIPPSEERKRRFNNQ